MTIASLTGPARYSDSTLTQNAQPNPTLIGTMRRAKSSRPVRRWIRGHSLANAHSIAGANRNGYEYRCRKIRVGTDSVQKAAGSACDTGISPQKAGSMCNGAYVALNRK